jgi:hypothetical protein
MSLTYCKHLIMFESIRLILSVCAKSTCASITFRSGGSRISTEDTGKSHPIKDEAHGRHSLKHFKALLYIFVTANMCALSGRQHITIRTFCPGISCQVLSEVATSQPLPLALSLHSASDVWSLMIVMETGSAGPVQRVNLRIRVQGSFKSPPTMIKLLDLFEKHSTILYLVSSCFIFQFVSYCFQKLHLFRMSLGLFMGASYLRSGTLIAVKRNVKCATLVRLG